MLFDSVEELVDFFKQIINQKKLSISNDLSGLKIVWSFIKGVKEDSIELLLTKKGMEKDKIIQTLVNEVQSLKVENKTINEKLSNLEKRIELLENKSKKDEDEKKIIQDNNNNTNKGLINKIITNKNEEKEFTDFLFRNQNMNFKFKLLYQATRDGDEISKIIEKIKGYSPTLFLIYTKSGVKCGGFTKALWYMDSNYKEDSSSFLFNFNYKNVFSIKNQKEAIYCNKNAACFGNYTYSDFFIRNKFLTQGIYEAKEKYSYNSNNYEVQGENDSKIYELEIYHCLN